jgi:hypothetical protein
MINERHEIGPEVSQQTLSTSHDYAALQTVRAAHEVLAIFPNCTLCWHLPVRNTKIPIKHYYG